MALIRLRAETQDLHRSVERAVDMNTVCSDLNAYRRFLTRALGFYKPVETALSQFAWEAIGLEFASRRKVHWLRADLQTLGIDADAIEALECCAALPQPVSLAGALGVMYVLEGATLGGQLMLRMVKDKLGVLPEGGASFHRGYGLQSGSQWRAFGNCAAQHLTDPERCDEAVQMARQTFESYGAWLKPERGQMAPFGHIN